jgi:hypothetical protein
MTPERAREKMVMGLPLLHGLDLEFDVQPVHELILKLATAVATRGRKNRPHKLRLQGAQTSVQCLNDLVT